MQKLTFLGVWMTPDVGETVSFAINLQQDGYVLVDCGTNLVGSLCKNGIAPTDISHIILTHSHGDHISGLPTYLFYRLLISPGIMGKRADQLTIVGTRQTLKTVKEYVRLAYGALADNPMLHYEERDSSSNYIVGDSEFKFFAARHQPDTMGFSVNLNGKKLVYSADTGISEEIIRLAENADFLIHDVVGTSQYKMLSGGHTLCSEISPLLYKYNVKNFYPVHRLSIYKDNHEEFIKELSAFYSGNVIIPNDGDTIEF